MRLGILGGVFDPPDLGHLVCAQEALVQLELDEVVMMPVGRAPHREIAADPGGETRLELCLAAVEDDGHLAVARLELDRPGPSYTVDTLGALPTTALVRISCSSSVAIRPRTSRTGTGRRRSSRWPRWGS